MAIIDKYSKEELEQIVQQSFSMKEVLSKLGYNTCGGNNHKTVKNRIDKYNIDISHFTYKKGIERNEENIFIENSTASQATLRRWYLKMEYNPYQCSICGQGPEWQGKELTLILDHINGKNHDDRKENLRWVCPNCNQQLETTGFKKIRVKETKCITKKYYCSSCGKLISASSKKGLCKECYSKTTRKVDRPTREELKELIRNKSFVSIANEYGVSDNAIRKWCDSYNLPRTKKDINSYSEKEWNNI